MVAAGQPGRNHQGCFCSEDYSFEDSSIAPEASNFVNCSAGTGGLARYPWKIIVPLIA